MYKLNNIASVVSNLSEKDTEAFFKAFFTPGELETLQKRVNLVQMLLDGAPQREIVNTLGVSFSQINRGSHELQYGTGKKFFPKFYQ